LKYFDFDADFWMEMSSLSFIHKTDADSNCKQLQINFNCEDYPLTLRSAFGTSHSITSSRVNALISLRINLTNVPESNGYVGYGEVGLPPKKPLCYLADLSDIRTYFEAFNKHVGSLVNRWDEMSTYDPFQIFDNEFGSLRKTRDWAMEIVRFLLYCLDTCPLNGESFSKAARSGIEACVLDWLGKVRKQPIYELIGVAKPLKPSFFTAALNPSIDAILDSVAFSRSYTQFLKIKLDANVERGFEILLALYQKFGSDSQAQWSVDANAAWNPEITLKFVEFLSKEPFRGLVYMIEQPFPVELGKYDLAESELKAWGKVKKVAEEHSLLIFADESVANFEDIHKLKPYIHGVNIKLEKAGGIREGLRALLVAKKEGLKTWVGSMVGSCLNSTTAAHLLALTDNGGDMDGGLLVDKKSQKFDGGFLWVTQPTGPNGYIGMATFPDNCVGIGVQYLQNS
jgi:L-alanine-DL-glutamate epimerase-like enolase superfamily enzyme